MEMDAIASAIIGGTLLSGGVGNIFGTLFGVLTLATIKAIVTAARLNDRGGRASLPARCCASLSFCRASCSPCAASGKRRAQQQNDGYSYHKSYKIEANDFFRFNKAGGNPADGCYSRIANQGA